MHCLENSFFTDIKTMSKNAALGKARNAKQDEFYTQYEDIQRELNHYEKHFEGKTVFCNCDDPFESNFCRFFLRNFNYLKLKRLICTSYSSSPVLGAQLLLFDEMEEPVKKGIGYVMDITEPIAMENGMGVSDFDINRLLKSEKRGVKKLKGDGDFRSEECIKYLKEADIVVTNPPFSLFREYMAQLMEYEKKFLIIGNQNAITYKEIFPLLMENKIWLGFKSGGMAFELPEKYLQTNKSAYKLENGKICQKLGNICWFTNLDHNKRHEKLELYCHYYGNEEHYPKYDNYDAINVDKVAEIPLDYFEGEGYNLLENREQNLQWHYRSANYIPRQTQSRAIHNHRKRIFSWNLKGQMLCCRKENVFKDIHSSQQDVMVAWECQSPSLINITQHNLRSSDSTDTSKTTHTMDTVSPFEEKKLTLESSSRENCSGIMGVPITFLDKYNPEQFEILGIANSARWIGSFPCLTIINGKKTYNRILIKAKQKR